MEEMLLSLKNEKAINGSKSHAGQNLMQQDCCMKIGNRCQMVSH